MASKLPKNVYVYLDDDTDENDEHYLNACRSVEKCADLDGARMVGVYELKSVEAVSVQIITSKK